MPRPRRTPRSTGRPRATGSLVLIVEDDVVTAEMYSLYLAANGFRFMLAGDGDTGVRIARSRQPDAIVMDLALPHVDGWEAMRRLKSDPLTAQILIVACTAHVFGAAGERAIEAGCDAYVIKPCLPDHLFEQIRTLLARSSPRRRA